MMSPINVLSLFDGISCGQLALSRANIPVSLYFASEIDKNAIAVTQHNFPNTIQIGDVTSITFSDFAGGIDLLLGGSPCQDLSVANKEREGLAGNKSSLFFYFVNALRTIKPKYFLFENNYKMPKEAKEIITDLLGVEPILINSALVSAQTRKRLYWTNIPTTPIQPREIKLQDVLEYGYADMEKSRCITRSYAKYYGSQSYMARRHFGQRFNTPAFLSREARDEIYDLWKRNNRFEDDEVKNNAKNNAKSNAKKIRQLTVTECERLQTLPDGYTRVLKKESKRYELIGNAWTVDVIAEILKGIEK